MDPDLDLPLLIIRNIPKEKSIHKLKSFLDSWVRKEIITYGILPLEDSVVLEVVCPALEAVKDISNLIFILAPWLPSEYEVQSQSSTILEENNLSSLYIMPCEVLTEIFRECGLKEQVALAKVCRKFYHIIKDLWRSKFKTLSYSLRKFEIVEKLLFVELEDFLFINGSEVETLVFMAYIEDGVFTDLQTEEANQMQANRSALNSHLSRNLIHFPNLKNFYIEGPLLLEETCSCLAKYCKKLVSFKFVDTGSRLLTGQYFYCMSKLEKLSLRGSQRIEFNNLSILCHMVKMISLNLTKCEPNLNARLIDKLCANLPELVTFKLSALHGEDMLTSIMQLPQLKRVQFNSYKVSFLSLILRKLDAYRTLSLTNLTFTYTRWLISRDISPQKKKWIKSHVARKIATKVQIEEDTFEELMEYLPHFYNLKQLCFEYNLVFNAKQLERMILEIPNLSKVVFKECCIVEHDSVIELMGKPEIMDKCTFTIEDIDRDIMTNHAIWIKAQSIGLLPPLTSIECYFQ